MQKVHMYQTPISRRSLSIGDSARVLDDSHPRIRRGDTKGDVVPDGDANGFTENDLYYLASLKGAGYERCARWLYTN
jgi:hypothetical protein